MVKSVAPMTESIRTGKQEKMKTFPEVDVLNALPSTTQSIEELSAMKNSLMKQMNNK